ncbi:MAG TPA: hypothetical protein VGQ18_06610 [Gemmatimonadales bacterium]|jgi:hypothetical protein|nr:hypothetical protein [Gemmatimonadales bacterium]
MPPLTRNAIVLLSVVGLACRAEPAALTGPRVVVTPQGLEQTVRFTPEEPATGDTLDVTSIVVNETHAAVDVSSRICGLDVESSLKLTNAFLSCAGYSMQGELAVGDTLQGFARRVIAGPPGNYTLRVRHLLNPDVWVEVGITVR